MAPEIALRKIELLTEPGDVVLDPMCGSGTVIRVAADQGRHGIGLDLDPLAVLMTRTSCHPRWSDGLGERARELVTQAKRRTTALPPWITKDEETSRFVSYWFARDQREQLSQLARALSARPSSDDPLRIALSRLIVTKDSGASLARDTAHSRPHRVRDKTSFDVMSGFERAAQLLENTVTPLEGRRRPWVRRGDSRQLSGLRPGSVDLALTSPPYLNAIDYLRGHRMTLVWLGWTIPELRELRAQMIGSERAGDGNDEDLLHIAQSSVARFEQMPSRQREMVLRFVRDMDRLCASLSRVVKGGGHLVLVVADSQLRGFNIRNSAICTRSAERHNFELVDEARRRIPVRQRYLPPPSRSAGMLSQRMKTETVFTLRRAS